MRAQAKIDTAKASIEDQPDYLFLRSSLRQDGVAMKASHDTVRVVPPEGAADVDSEGSPSSAMQNVATNRVTLHRPLLSLSSSATQALTFISPSSQGTPEQRRRYQLLADELMEAETAAARLHVQLNTALINQQSLLELVTARVLTPTTQMRATATRRRHQAPDIDRCLESGYAHQPLVVVSVCVLGWAGLESSECQSVPVCV